MEGAKHACAYLCLRCNHSFLLHRRARVERLQERQLPAHRIKKSRAQMQATTNNSLNPPPSHLLMFTLFRSCARRLPQFNKARANVDGLLVRA